MASVKQVQVTFDCAVPERVARFWCEVLGYVVPPPPEGFATWDDFDRALPPERQGSAFACIDPSGVGSLPETRQAIANLLQPDQEYLRLPADVLAEAFLGMSLGAARTPHPDRSPLPSDQLVDLFLHGALSTTNPA
jgi:hypothetical protein